MRFGLVGTGPWAGMAHGPGLLEADKVDLVGVWGRDHTKAQALAGSLRVRAYDEFEQLLMDVDAVAFAVPPGIQAELALLAANRGKHLLLDKPVALTVPAAHALQDAVAAAAVSSVVFFTDRFASTSRSWFEDVRRTGGWRGGWLRSFSSLQELDNPFRDSPWRWANGALWDLGPHALSTLTAALGPITSLSAVPGERDLVAMALQHESGAASTASLTMFAPLAATGHEAAVWGESGVSTMPSSANRSISQVLAVAADELVTSARTGISHEVGVTFGVRVVELLADAQAHIQAAHGL